MHQTGTGVLRHLPITATTFTSPPQVDGNIHSNSCRLARKPEWMCFSSSTAPSLGRQLPSFSSAFMPARRTATMRFTS